MYEHVVEAGLSDRGVVTSDKPLNTKRRDANQSLKKEDASRRMFC